MKEQYYRDASTCVFATVLQFVATPCVAQAGEATIPTEGEIVVTAQRREQSLQDVPISVSVVSGEALERSAVRSLDDLSSRMPAVRIVQAPAADQLNIRGFGSGLNSGFEQAVATFVDGSYRGRSRAIRAALFDIERLEVLKGPQTTFFGNNAIAGALNITTKKPGSDLEANGSLLYSVNAADEYAAEGGVSVPLTDKLGIRVATRWSGMNGYIKNDLSARDAPRQRDWIGRISLAWQPLEDVETNIRFDRGVMRQDGYLSSELIGCPSPYAGLSGYNAVNVCTRYLAASGPRVDDKLDLHTSEPSGHSLYKYNEAAMTNGIAIGNHRLSLTTSYFEHKVDAISHLMPLPVKGVGGGSLFPNKSWENYHNFAQEIRLESPSGGTIEYMLGAYYARSTLSANLESGFFFVPFGMYGAPVTDANTPIAGQIYLDQKDRTLSGFGSMTVNVDDQLQLNVGLRYSVVEKTASRVNYLGTDNADHSDFVILPASTQAAIRNILGGSADQFPHPRRTDRKLMPSVNLRYELNDDVMTYASYTKGFKAGGFGGSSLPDEFGPETVDAFELGTKINFLNRRAFLTVTAFCNNFKGLQESSNIFTPAGTILSVVRNVGSTRSQGIEAGGTLRISRNLSLNSEITWLDSSYRDFRDAPCTALQSLQQGAACNQDLSGKRRPWAPKFSGNLGATIIMPIGDNQIRLDPNLYFTTGYYQSATIERLLYQPGYVKLDARLAYGPSNRNWELAVIGRNVTNKLTASFRNNVGTSFGTLFALPERGRSVALQLSIRK